jgi:uncharacterized protein with ATP-grasp and redox domains
MDTRAVPPRISTGDAGTFAEKTLKIRLPEQIDLLLVRKPAGRDLAVLPTEVERGLSALKARLAGGVVRDLLGERPEVREGMAEGERRDWTRSIAAHLGRPWSDIPWYFAESLFYLEVLAAWGWYSAESPGFRQDPFEPMKLEELSRPQGGIARVEKVLRHGASIPDPERRLAALLRHALWGNRMDLTFGELVERYGSGALGEQEELLIDHSQATARRALAARRVDLVLDNAGTELACDLAMVHALVVRGVRVVLHVKDSPFYVSDAMAKDVRATVRALSARGKAATVDTGAELQEALGSGALEVRPHWFWNGPLLYPEWPEEIRRELASSDLLVFKGDVNYRRLLDDRRWDPETPMEELTAYVPTAFAVLRTLKSEVIVDLPRSTVTALAREDPQWSVRGHYGVARLRE